MQKNWYVVYTRPKCEKKVSNALTKRKVENFCPQNRKQIKHLRKHKLVLEPLFSSYVFVNIEEENLGNVLSLESVVSLVYWRGAPAIIHDQEIQIINRFVSDHEDVKLEKSKVDLEAEAKVVDRPAYILDGKVLTLKNKSIKVNLPSIGFTLVAEVGDQETIVRESQFLNQEMLLQ